jgi:hypothetical protein
MLKLPVCRLRYRCVIVRTDHLTTQPLLILMYLYSTSIALRSITRKLTTVHNDRQPFYGQADGPGR